ncbi:MAG: hypothetical protein WB607_25825 [Candidatus Acidiferrum sp.]|jgi:hypothetical protein
MLPLAEPCKSYEISPKGSSMNRLKRLLLATAFVLPVVVAPAGRAQTNTAKTENKTVTSPEAETQKKNTQAYINLLRSDVRQQKAEIMGAVMLLSAQEATKFWPIYSDYDAQLAKLNDQRVENIKEYAQNYDQMTDEKADELIQKSMAYQKQRAELLAQTYNKVKQSLGAVTAARFAMVEHQLLLIIDLQIASSLPVVGQGS